MRGLGGRWACGSEEEWAAPEWLQAYYGGGFTETQRPPPPRYWREKPVPRSAASPRGGLSPAQFLMPHPLRASPLAGWTCQISGCPSRLSAEHSETASWKQPFPPWPQGRPNEVAKEEHHPEPRQVRTPL